jgi:hypothetical protein
VAATAPAAFNEFARRLALTPTQRAKLRERRDLVLEYVSAEWTVDAVMFGGSHARGTKIRQVPGVQGDVDLYVILNEAHKRYGTFFHSDPPGKLLVDLRRTFARALVRTTLRADAPCVRVSYADMVVDVVPAFRVIPFFGSSDQLDIPYKRDWRRATPIGQQRVFAELDAKQGGRLKPLLRMIKHWRAKHRSIGLRSYHLEVLAYNTFTREIIDDYGVALWTFFRHAASDVRQHVVDPGGSGNVVSDYLTRETAMRASKMFTVAATYAGRAVDASTYMEEIRRWRSPSLLGAQFPGWTLR